MSEQRGLDSHTTQFLTELFGFWPLRFLDEILNSVNELIYQVSAGMETFVLEQLGNGLEAQQGMHQFETLLEWVVDRNFDLFEMYVIQNVLRVPEDARIVMAHQEGLDYSIEEACEEELDKRLDLARKKLLAAKTLKHKLKKDLALTDLRIGRYEQYRNQISFLTTVAQKHKITPVSDTVKLVTDQLYAVKNLVQTLEAQVSQEQLAKFVREQKPDERMTFIRNIITDRISKKRKETPQEIDNWEEEMRKRAKTDQQNEKNDSLVDKAMEENKIEALQELLRILGNNRIVN